METTDPALGFIGQRAVALNMTAADLGREVGVHRQTAHLWIIGRTMPTAKHWAKLADALHLTTEALARGLSS